MKQNILTCNNNKYKYGYWLAIITSVLLLSLILNYLNIANAAVEDMTTVVQRIEKNINSVGRLMVLISYVAGIGFAMAGVLQFKAHKDNPTQVPLSKPIVYICVAAFLLFLPQLMTTAGKTVFDSTTDLSTKDNLKVEDISSK